MVATLEDLDHRVTALEKAAEAEKSIVRAVAELIAKSETRTGEKIDDLRAEVSVLRTDIARVDSRVSDTERRMVDLLNDKFDQVMTALDRLAHPPT